MILRVLLALSLLTPGLAFSASAPSNFKGVILIIVEIITALWPLIAALAFFYFLWGLARYLKNAGEERDEAKEVMVHGVIAFFMMASLWAFVAVLTKTFGTESGTNIPPSLYGVDPFELEEEEEPQVFYEVAI